GAAAEAGQSRIYGGIHFQFDNQDGLASGHELGEYVFGSFLTPVPATAKPSTSSRASARLSGSISDAGTLFISALATGPQMNPGGSAGGHYGAATAGQQNADARTSSESQAPRPLVGTGGSTRQGIGGAHFVSGGTVCLDLFTVANIFGNTASTNNHDV